MFLLQVNRVKRFFSIVMSFCRTCLFAEEIVAHSSSNGIRTSKGNAICFSRTTISSSLFQDSFDRQTRQTEQLEQKFDHLLKKKRDLEARLHRIPSRGLTNTDHQLYDVLEREIERVDQQIMTVKLDLRKSNTLRTC